VPDGESGVAAAVRREFGGAPAAVSVAGTGSVSYPIPPDRAATGWSLALWLVCHATALHATSVTFDGRRWTSTASDRGWTHTASAPGTGRAGAVAVTLGANTQGPA
jgi:hypothetical protein